MTYICFIIQYFRPPKVRLWSNNLRNPMQDIISNFFCVGQHSLFVSSSFGPPAIGPQRRALQHAKPALVNRPTALQGFRGNVEQPGLQHRNEHLLIKLDLCVKNPGRQPSHTRLLILIWLSFCCFFFLSIAFSAFFLSHECLHIKLCLAAWATAVAMTLTELRARADTAVREKTRLHTTHLPSSRY